ncbi:MAG: hypothetical protein K0S11_794 [Gammaproteobacteria bacterium]|nr:hypothetical protein [Gammaproteobacteria bacterium]
MIAEIQQLTPHNEIFGHTKRVTSLQRLAAEAYADNEIPFEAIYQNMLKQLNHLKRLDNLRHKVGELKFSRDCKAYQLACIYLAQDVDSAYAKPNAGEKLVSALEQHYEKLIHSRQAVRAYHQAITQLQDHGNKRFAKDYPEAKRSVDKLVTDLNSKLQNYLTTPNFNNKTADRFIKESKNSIKQADAILSQHRGWKKVIYNVGICLTGIGAVVLGAKNIYSYAKSGQLSFFKVQTDSNAKLLVIKDQLAELAKPMLPVINS